MHEVTWWEKLVAFLIAVTGMVFLVVVEKRNGPPLVETRPVLVGDVRYVAPRQPMEFYLKRNFTWRLEHSGEIVADGTWAVSGDGCGVRVTATRLINPSCFSCTRIWVEEPPHGTWPDSIQEVQLFSVLPQMPLPCPRPR